ncbi:hypothetical protein, partial [Streptomyces otsuchiensis]|uniref:hypothetical protein n=1 Tax=Streptomyces otsuchiensis TaxID=2681388 RepID=UPI001D132516
MAASTALVSSAGWDVTMVGMLRLRSGASAKRLGFVTGCCQRGQHCGRGLGVTADARDTARQIHVDGIHTR